MSLKEEFDVICFIAVGNLMNKIEIPYLQLFKCKKIT